MKSTLMILVFAQIFSVAQVRATQDPATLPCLKKREILVESKAVDFCWDDGSQAWLSRDCFKGGKVSCGAMELLRAVRNKKVTISAEDLLGGKNPGSVLCSKLGGVVMMARYASGSQQSFCQGRDGRLISCNVLSN